MIALSRTGSGCCALAYHRLRRNLWFRAWPVCCSAVLHGCFYVTPVWRPTVNSPPEIFVPADAVSTLRMRAARERVFVVATDADPGDDVYFYWDVPHGVASEVQTFVEGEGEDVQFVSNLTVDKDPILDGAEISCTVTDLEPGHRVRLTWQVEVE